ncbi:branched-chain amino acid aminotransferase [Atractiella rhizophila]|nr:branched-chain amino acid aminotransferase [Atractiella rhizophila]
MPTFLPPNSSVDWDNLKFELSPTHGYVLCQWTESKGWDAEPRFVEGNQLSINVASIALNYGQTCFEGLKAFRRKDGSIKLFRPQENAKRLATSAEAICLPPVSEELFLKACHLVVEKNQDLVPPYSPNALKGSLYIRPVLYGAGGGIMLRPSPEVNFIVFCTPAGGFYAGGSEISNIPSIDAVVVDDFDRTAPLGTGHSKLGGNYAPVFGPASKAKQMGFGITLHLDSLTHTYIDEFSTSNFLGVKYTNSTDPTMNPVLVVPQSPTILPSITQKSIVELANVLGWTVEIRPVRFEEVESGSFNEVGAVGTAAVITPVKSIAHRRSLESKDYEKIKINDGNPTVLFKLIDELTGIQAGDKDDRGKGWCWWPED